MELLKKEIESILIILRGNELADAESRHAAAAAITKLQAEADKLQAEEDEKLSEQFKKIIPLYRAINAIQDAAAMNRNNLTAAELYELKYIFNELYRNGHSCTISERVRNFIQDHAEKIQVKAVGIGWEVLI